jgi:hypothetical protein
MLESEHCLVQLLPQEYVLSLILDRERGTPKPSKMPRLGAEEVDMKKGVEKYPAAGWLR